MFINLKFINKNVYTNKNGRNAEIESNIMYKQYIQLVRRCGFNLQYRYS